MSAIPLQIRGSFFRTFPEREYVLTSSSEAQTHRMEDFLMAAVSRVSSRNAAVQTLQRIGSPPISKPDISNPSSSARSVLDVLAFLGCSSTSSNESHVKSQTILCIKRNWDSYIGPWVEYLLKNFVIVDNYSQTNKGLEFYDNILYVVPLLLFFPVPSKTETAEFCQKTVQLRTQVLNPVWLKVISTMHISWGRWSAMLSSVYFRTNVWPFWPELVMHAGENARRQLAAIGVQHLRRVALHLTQMKASEMPGVQTSLLLISGCLEVKDPSFLPALICGAAPALVNILRSLLSRKVLRRYSEDGSSTNTLMNTLEIAATCLGNTFIGPTWISEALEVGFIDVLFKTFRLQILKQVNGNSSFWRRLGESLIQTALYMVYPSVLHRFMGYMNRVVKSGLEDELKVAWPDWPLWPVWQQCCQRACSFSDLFAIAKKSLCCYAECQRKKLRSVDSQTPRYLRCSKCLSASYCSPECARADWGINSVHRNSCSELAQQLADGIPQPNYIDVYFFTILVEMYVLQDAESLSEAIVSLPAPKPAILRIPGFGDVDLTRKVIILQLSDLDIEHNTVSMPRVAASVTDLEKIVQDTGLDTESGKRIFPELFRAAKRARSRDFVVLALFPVTIGRLEKSAWPVVSIVKPLAGPGTTDDEESSPSEYESSVESGSGEATSDMEEIGSEGELEDSSEEDEPVETSIRPSLNDLD